MNHVVIKFHLFLESNLWTCGRHNSCGIIKFNQKLISTKNLLDIVIASYGIVLTPPHN